MGKLYTHVDSTEKRLVKNMVKEGLTWAQVQRITGRIPDTINGILQSGKAAVYDVHVQSCLPRVYRNVGIHSSACNIKPATRTSLVGVPILRKYTVPLQCPYSAPTVPSVNYHSALAFVSLN